MPRMVLRNGMHLNLKNVKLILQNFSNFVYNLGNIIVKITPEANSDMTLENSYLLG